MSEGRSGEGFQIGESRVFVTFGYADGGDRLLFAVVRSFSPGVTLTEDHRLEEGRWGSVYVRDNDGKMIPVERDGSLYVFDGDKLRTMKVKMNEHSDTNGLNRCKSIEEILAFFKQFEIRKRDLQDRMDSSRPTQS